MFNKKPESESRELALRPVNIPPKQPRNYSEVAIEAAQHVVDLENHIHSLQGKLSDTLNRLDLVEKANDILHADMARLKSERDFYHDRCTAIETKLQVSANIILEALQAAHTAVDKKLDATVDKVLAAAKEHDVKTAEAAIEEQILDQYRPPAARKHKAASEQPRNEAAPLPSVTAKGPADAS